MKKQKLAAALSMIIFLTGCGVKKDLTVQQDDMPVVPAETTYVRQAEVTAANETKTTTAMTEKSTETVRTGTSNLTSAPAASTNTSAAATGTAAETAATQPATGSSSGNSGNSGSTRAADMLWGKWETVSFSKDSGGSVSFDLSDSVHRTYYVGLDLNEQGQSSVTVGSKTYPASAGWHGNRLSVDSIDLNNSVSLDFTLSADRTRLTVGLLDGRIIATLKRIQNDFSIRAFLTAEPEPDISAIVGEWYYLNPDESVGSVITVNADGTFEETVVENYNMTFGTVKIENGFYSFYSYDGDLYLRFLPDPLNRNEFTDDNMEDGRLVSQRDYDAPNAEGFYDPVILPLTSVAPAGLIGIWQNADGSGETLEITEHTRAPSRARYILTDAAGKENRGDIRIQYQLNPEGEKEYCFTFYDDSGYFRFAMEVTSTIQLTDLYGYQSGEPHFVLQ